jgi:dienelactone hydrolase
MMPSNLEIFEHTHEGRAYVSRIARPSGKGPHPGVLVMHDGQGVGAFLCERAQRLANLGYVALATDMFGEGRQHSDPAEGSAAVIALRKDGEGLRKRVAAAFRAFSTLPDVDAGRVAAIGFCFGGQ